MAAKFPFNDLHSFKDYVGFVRMCAPELFPYREGRPDVQLHRRRICRQGFYLPELMLGGNYTPGWAEL